MGILALWKVEVESEDKIVLLFIIMGIDRPAWS